MKLKYTTLFFTFIGLFLVFGNNSLQAQKVVKADLTGVSLVDNGTTVTMKNNLVSVTVTKATANVSTILYENYNILTGGHNGGMVYWSWNRPTYKNPSNCTYTLITNPLTNNNDGALIKLHMTWNALDTTAAPHDVDIYYALRRNVSGLYAAAKLSHPVAYPLLKGGEWRMVIYTGNTFTWLTVDSARNQLLPPQDATTVAVSGAPAEVVRITSPGAFENHYECKYDYSADFGEVNTWGWSSPSRNIGIWMTIPSMEYNPGGPMKRELMGHSGPTLLNMFGGTHYTMGSDGDVAAGESWEKVYGPYLIYCNKVPAGTAQAPNVLWENAKAQTKIESAQWPYSWFTEPSYVQASGRGTVTGKLVINDPTEPSISSANMWVGVAVPQISVTGITDFQLWCKNYQFWCKTDTSGNFTLTNVLPGTYDIYAFGSAAAGQMTKKAYLTVTAGQTTSLGNVVWQPYRLAPTVWEIGIPDRTSKEFKHGDDYWIGGTYPDLAWAKFMNYKSEFPNEVNYTIGKSNWATDWNYVQPYNLVATDQTVAPEWKVNFTLTSDPTAGSNSSLYIAAASSFLAPMFVKINGTNITVPTTGVNFPNSSNGTIRMANHGAFGDLRFTFPSSMLHAGNNVISLTLRRAGGDIQYDYLRLESPGTQLISSVPKNSFSSKLTVYPNPFVDVLNLKTTTNSASDIRVAIQALDGKVVYRKSIVGSGNNFNLNLSTLNSGLYLMELSVNKSVTYHKIVKK